MRSRAGYWLAGLLAVAGLAAAVLVGIGAASRIGERIDGFASVPAGSAEEIRLPEGDLSVFFEVEADDPPVRPSEIDVRIERAPGRPLELRPSDFELTYDIGSRRGRRIAKVRVPEAGTYVTGVIAPAGRALVGEVPGLADAGRIVLAIMLATLGLLLATLLAILTAVRRRRA